jgi:hypothetical protein
MVTAQEAADTILRELKTPMSSKDLARLALERGLLRSHAQRPIDSLAQTIEKNIRDGVYNKPELKFVYSPAGRLVALPNWELPEAPHSSPAASATSAAQFKDVTARLPIDIAEQVQLAAYAKVAESFDDTVALLLQRGLASVASQVEQALMARVRKLGAT